MTEPSSPSPGEGSEPSPAPLWTPSADRIASTAIDQFRCRYLPNSTSTDELWRWSIDEPGLFWRALWEWCEIIGDPGPVDVAPGQTFAETRFLPEARLNIAQNLLADRNGGADDEPAILFYRDDGQERTLSWAELRRQVAAMAAALRADGVEAGDRVAAWMPHMPETVVAFLAAASIGAVFTSTSADFGPDGVVDRFGQTEPKVLVAADGYYYGGRRFDCLDRLGEIQDQLPTLIKTYVVANLDSDPTIEGANTQSWTEALAANMGADTTYAQLPGDHPLYILYSSGTTGKPKCIVHRSAGVLLKHLSEQRLHSDIFPGDRVFFFTTCGWMMWNWLVSALGAGATIVLYDGNPLHPRPTALFDIADQSHASLLGVSAKYIDAVMKTGQRPADELELARLKTICSTGSPLSPEGFAWIYDAVATDVHLASISGGTDLCGCLVIGDPTRPVYAGEIQAKALGVAVDVFDDRGQPAPVDTKGELVCTQPFPSMPLGFWGDDDGSRYRAAYFERFDGVWAHGDFASWTEHGGMVIHGRSDATLNASGVRIGTAEIYRVVEQLDEVVEAIAIGQEWDDDTRVVLFVRLAEGGVLDGDLVARIKTDLRAKCSPRHVPAVVVEVADIPRTRSGKIVELAVAEVVHGRQVRNLEALANPEALDLFADRRELA
ncbi:MAG: acetoacetate--CoA ligase [Actinomycetia bacterium]|nr:acetoacetate--CoA ligase [Actinomycetes bacterium]MCP5033888.1 acetoacetate--CoA ligase [Actinomycetes bacterium]